MATEFFIPKLGQTVEEVTLVSWSVEDGQKVDFGDQVMEVETDKAVFPVEANGKGFIHLGPYKDGDVVPVLTVVAIIGAKDDTFSTGAGPEAAQTEPQETAAVQPEPVLPANGESEMGETDKLFASPRARKLAQEKGVNLSQVIPTGEGGKRVAERDVIAYLKHAPKVTPLAQRMASAAGVDLQGVTGTGPGGKIVKEDIARAAAGRETQAAPAQPAPAASVPLPEAEVTDRVPLTGVRGIIANRMGMSVHTTARVTLITDVDATEFVAARTRLKDRVERDWGFAPGYNDLLARIAATALRKFPYMNARLAEDAIEHMAQVNIGMAVDTDRGLLVPVIRHADRKSLRQFGSDFRELVERARKGRSLPDDLSGGTFTITNLGMYDIDAFTPVINLPEAAILGVGRIVRKPAEYKGEIALRHMLTLSLVFDHRLVDGAPAARFLQYIKQVIEEPYLLLAE
jgi:pyruvate dehydrogenase E2 component (dihydrolipoamide acetyltransferase)